jgi:hypothetical protein
MDTPRRTEPLREERAPEAPAPQPVYLQAPQNYPSDTPMIDATVEAVAGTIEIGLRLFCVLVAVCFAAGFGSIAGAPGAVIAGGAAFLYGMDLAVGRTATIGVVAFILVIALFSWTSEMAEVRDFNEGFPIGEELCIGFPPPPPPAAHDYSYIGPGEFIKEALPKTDMGHDDYSEGYAMGVANGCDKTLGLDYTDVWDY